MWFVVAVGVCVVWTVTVVIWMSPSRLATSQASSRTESVLTTMATLSGAAIVLALTAILVGLQLSSRFGFASKPNGHHPTGRRLMGVAGLLGVAVPLWAAAEPWQWLRTAGLASFAWTILALGVAVSRILAHLNPRWLAAHQVERLYRFLTPSSKPVVHSFAKPSRCSWRLRTEPPKETSTVTPHVAPSPSSASPATD